MWIHKNLDTSSYEILHKYSENNNSLNLFNLDSKGLTVQHNWRVYCCLIKLAKQVLFYCIKRLYR